MAKKVTVITGYYNREDCVDETIISLLNQSYDDYEIVAFDDHSTDNTYWRLKKYECPGLRVIRFTKNIGFVNCLIEVIRQTNSEYIAIHGSGDIAFAKRIEKQAKALDEDPNIVMVGCHLLNSDRANNLTAAVKNREFIYREDLFKFNQFSHGEIMFRREVYDIAGGYRSIFKFSQDYDLWFRLLEHGKARILQEILYERIIQFEGVSYKPEKIVRQEMFGILAMEINKLPLEGQLILEKKFSDLGLSEIVDINHPLIQKSLFRKYNMLMFKNKLSDFTSFIENSHSYYKIYYQVTSTFYRSGIFRKTVNGLYALIYK